MSNTKTEHCSVNKVFFFDKKDSGQKSMQRRMVAVCMGKMCHLISKSKLFLMTQSPDDLLKLEIETLFEKSKI